MFAQATIFKSVMIVMTVMSVMSVIAGTYLLLVRCFNHVFVKLVIFKTVMSVSTVMSVVSVIGKCICYITIINCESNHISECYDCYDSYECCECYRGCMFCIAMTINKFQMFVTVIIFKSVMSVMAAKRVASFSGSQFYVLQRLFCNFICLPQQVKSYFTELRVL